MQLWGKNNDYNKFFIVQDKFIPTKYTTRKKVATIIFLLLGENITIRKSLLLEIYIYSFDKNNLTYNTIFYH